MVVQGQYFNASLFIILLLQHTSVSPDRRLIVVVGDHTDGLIVDSRNGTVRKFFAMHRLNPVRLYLNASRGQKIQCCLTFLSSQFGLKSFIKLYIMFHRSH